MTADWQTYIAILIVFASAAFLVRRVVQLVRKRGCGGGCTGCSSRAAGKTHSQIVTLRNFR